MHAFDQAHRVDQKGTDDRGIQTLVVQHQHRVVEAGARVHHEAARARLRRPLAKVGRHEALPVHQGDVQVLERGHRATAAISRQACHRGTLQEEGQQFGLLEYPRDQFAILEVVVRQGGLVLGEHAVDFIHALVRRTDRLAFAQQRLCDIFQAERGKAPGGRTQRLDTIDDQAPRRRGEKVMSVAMLAPLQFFAATAKAQRYLQALGMVTQDTQIELHKVPADDRIGIMPGEPVVQPFDQLATAVAVVELEIDGRVAAVLRSQHVDLTLATAFQPDGIQRATGIGLDIQRHQAQVRPIAWRRLHPRLMQAPIGLDDTAKAHRRGDEALHQITLRWPDVRFVDGNTRRAQALVQIPQLAILRAVQAQHRAVPEIGKLQLAQLHALLVAQQWLGQLALLDRNEADGGLIRQAEPLRPVIGRQPELDVRARRRVTPVTGQDKPLPKIHRITLETCPRGNSWRTRRNTRLDSAQGGGCKDRAWIT